MVRLIKKFTNGVTLPLVPAPGNVWDVIYAFIQLTTTSTTSANFYLYRNNYSDLLANLPAQTVAGTYNADGSHSGSSLAGYHVTYYGKIRITQFDGINTGGTVPSGDTVAWAVIVDEHLETDPY